MPRLARIVLKDVAHHITQRGNNRQDVFFVDDDRKVYLEILKEQSVRFGLDVYGYREYKFTPDTYDENYNFNPW